MPASAEVMKTATVCDIPADLPPAPDIAESNSTKMTGPIVIGLEKSLPRKHGVRRDVYLGALLVDPQTGDVSTIDGVPLNPTPHPTSCD